MTNHTQGLTVLSLFDGMSCGRIALERNNQKVSKYYASEIDKYAIAVSQYNYPDTIQLGDINNWRDWDIDWASIDLVLAGSPCQGFSFSGKGLAFDDPRSKLFFVFVDTLNHVKSLNQNVTFLLENVQMKREWQDIITEYTGTEPILINSSLVSAQSRKRLYWTNIPNVSQPLDRKIGWGSIREYGVDNNFYYTENGLAWISKHSIRKNKPLRVWKNNEKCQMIEASHFKNYSSQRFFGIQDESGLRYITPLECERAQTLPDNYTKYGCLENKTMEISNTQRYKMTGNGWTVDVICHILKGMK